MYRLYNPNNKAKRIKMTQEEKFMSKFLRQKIFDDILFYRHYRLGNYIVDFICESKKIIIDIFYGDYKTKEEMKLDKERLKFFKEAGYKAVRIMNKELELSLELVYGRVLSACEIHPVNKAKTIIDFNNQRYQKFIKDIERERSFQDLSHL